MFQILINILKRIRFRRRWRSINRHNLTNPKRVFPIESVRVGRGTYGSINALVNNLDNELIIGNYCSIGPEVSFILSSEHLTNTVTTYPFRVKMLGQAYEGTSKGDIIVEDDVWIGYGATIMSGVTIGQGAVIGAGAVVTKDVPPYAIVAGVPARIVRYRFPDDLIEKLKTVNLSRIDIDYVRKHVEALYLDLTKQENIDTILNELRDLWD